ncbi:MAG: cryptochrome/photolyase family protein [Cytophagales bacterium]
MKTLRLILGDQLNERHSWFADKDDSVLYVLMEIKAESDYVKHHIQKILGFFAAMRSFSEKIEADGHRVKYFKISDKDNQHSFEKNIKSLIKKHNIKKLEYQEADEYRLDHLLKSLSGKLNIETRVFSSEHFIAERNEVADFFGNKAYLMESFYQHMRKKHNILMDGAKPEGGSWNYDQQNRKKIPKGMEIPEPYTFQYDLSLIKEEIDNAGLDYFGNADEKNFIWPIYRNDGLKLLREFISNNLKNFGPYQDAMGEKSWSNFHSRLSFALNLKMISPVEVIEIIEEAYEELDEEHLSSVEGFIRQILGWREYMRGIYWAKMPAYEKENFFGFSNSLPKFFWTGKTNMKCLEHSIGQSLDFAYAHHIQRLMVTGNFALLMECDPDEVDAWYLGVYIDAIQWVEITNTRGMSQYADGGLLSSKPYISSANYINKMSAYCGNCKYDHKIKYGENACPFNSLYWNFLDMQKDKLKGNPRMGMMYNLLNKMDNQEKSKIIEQANFYLENRDNL